MIKHSKKLNKMMNELFRIDFYWVDCILTNHADYYTISEKTSAEDAVRAGYKLLWKSLEKQEYVYEVRCCSGNFSAYFIGDFKKIAGIFTRVLTKAKMASGYE